MADEQQVLTAKITVDTGSAPASVDDLDKRLENLEQAFIRTQGAAKDTGKAHQELGGVLKEHGDLVDEVAGHYRMMSAGLGALGVDADAAAVKIDALTEVVRGLGSAAPELLAIGAAIAVAAASFSFLKDSVDTAAASERELVTVGALIKNQGVTDWQAQTKAVDDYASSIARTSVFQKTDALAGIQAMLVAGLSLNDAIRSQASAMDLAAAKGITLAQADQELADAYDGRVRGLVKLGLVTKEEQENGIAYEAILARIEDRMSGSAAAALDTYSGKMQNLSNLTDLLKEEFGNALLPVVEAFEDAMRTGVEDMQPLGDEFAAWAHEHLPELKAGAEGFANALFGLAKQALPLVEQGIEIATQDLADLGKEWGDNSTAVDGWVKHIKDAKSEVDSVTSAIGAIGDFLLETQQDFESSGAAVHQWAVGIGNDINWVLDLVIPGLKQLQDATQQNREWAERWGNTPIGEAVPGAPASVSGGWGGDGSSDVAPPNRASGGIKHAPPPKPVAPPTHPSNHMVQGTRTPHPQHESGSMDELIGAYDKGNPIVAAFKQQEADLDAQLKLTDASEKQLAESVKTALTVEAQRAAQAALEAKTFEDLLGKQKDLTAAIDSEKMTQASLQSTISALISERDKLAAQHDAIAQKERDGAKLTAQQSREMHALQQQVHAVDGEIGKLNASLTENNSNLNRNNAALASVLTQLDAFKNKSAEAFAAASRAWEEYKAKSDTAVAEDLATLDMTNAQKVLHYAAALAQMSSLDADYSVKHGVALAQIQAAEDAERAHDSQANRQRLAAALQADATITDAYVTDEKRREQLDAQYNEAYKAALKDQEEAVKSYLDRARGYETAFIDDVLVQHKGLGQSLKDVFNNILGDWEKMVEQMIVKSSLLNVLNSPGGAFGKFLQSIGLGAAVGVGAMGAAPDPGVQAAYSAYVAAEAKATTSTNLRATTEDRATTSTSAAATALNQLTSAAEAAAKAVGSRGSGSGSGFGSGDDDDGSDDDSDDGMSEFFGGDTSVDGGDGMGAFYGADDGIPVNVSSIGGSALPSGASALPTTVTAFAGAAQGMMIAQVVDGLTGGNSTWGSVGGAVGGIFGGPIGAAIGAAIGGLFGPHETKADQPDINDPNWGQLDTNWNGASGSFNGTTVNPESQYNASNGGTALDDQVAAWVKASSANPGGLTQAQQQLYGQILNQIMGGNPNATGAQYGIAREAQGNVYFGDGESMPVSTFESLMSSYSSTVGTGTASSALFQVSRSYPNLNAGQLNANGTYSPTPANGTTAGSSTGTSTSSGAPGSAAQGASGDLVIQLQIGSTDIAKATVGPLSTLMARRGQRIGVSGSPNSWGSPSRYVKT